ncbi:MAG TPA: enoyl-CoA hydratase [Gemmatimonadaceae bacterium]|jgi:2-(1,2-epoxy-1,2-dihydrophenyl)acetyl-CoA isomerase|nr:enoyl-CoA hydratase [Gemmatimonadaceae bacterium]
MSSFEHILLQRDGAIGTLVLNRPEKLNAFAGTMRGEIADALDELEADARVRVIIITGAGRGFCAGADVGYMAELIERRDEEAMAALVEAGRRVVTTIRRSSKPVIASLNGVAAGGGANLALACDMRIASDRAKLGQTFNRIGLCPDWGGTYFLPRLVGPAKSLELFWLAEIIDAEECLRLGLVNRVVPHDLLAQETTTLARTLADKPALALSLAKRAVYESLDQSLPQMLDAELEMQLQCFRSGDAAEGITAFLEKRTAEFGREKLVRNQTVSQ